MSNYVAINMDKIELAARQERAAFIAELAQGVSSKLDSLLGKVFVSELRTSRAKTLARLQAA